MIIGIGSDLLDIGRIEKLMAQSEQRFIERCFTPEEQEKAEKRRSGGTHINTYAKHFAAKEACAKALGTGFGSHMGMKEIIVLNNELGAPEIELRGGALKRLHDLVPKDKTAVIHVTLTDEPPMALAQVIIEAY